MANFEFWKLATDILLMMSLIYLGYRFFSSPDSLAHSRQVAELEASIRALIKEADVAGKSLNEQLTRRQSALEKLLFDLETAEHRVGRTVTAAEESERSLKSKIQRIEEIRGDLGKMVSQPRSSSKLNIEKIAERDEPADRDNEAPAYQDVDEVILPPEPVAPVRRTPVPSSASAPKAPQVTKARSTNIYGEEISSEPEVTREPVAPQRPRAPERAPQREAAAPAPRQSAPRPAAQQQAQVAAPAPKAKPVETARSSVAQRYKNLSANVEKSVQAAEPAQTPARETIQIIERAAEDMLKAGKDLEYVSAKTRLPIGEVRHIQRKIITAMSNERAEKAAVQSQRSAPQEQAMEIEEFVDEQPNDEIQDMPRQSDDPRLGVLGGMKRQTQVL